MDAKLLKQFGKALTKEKAKVNQRIVIFTFFLVVATILWYLNKLSYEYDTELHYPVRFENFPKGKVIVGEPPNNIKIGVKAFGYTLLRYKVFASLSPIVIDLKRFPLQPQSGTESMFYITSTRLRAPIISQLRGELQLLSVLPDTIFFELTNLVQRRVPVTPNLHISYERQHMLSGPIVIDPDSIIISGPKTIIDTIEQIKTPLYRFEKLTTTEEKNISLITIPQVGFSHRRISVTIPVEKFTETLLTIPIDIRNLPYDTRLTLLPRTINIKCNVSISQYTNLSSRHFDAYVDFNAIDPSKGNKLRVHIISQEKYLGNFDFEPKFVEYIIEKL